MTWMVGCWRLLPWIRAPLIAIVAGAASLMGRMFGSLLPHDLDPAMPVRRSLFSFAAAALLGQTAIGLGRGSLLGRWQIASFAEMVNLAASVAVMPVVLVGVLLTFDRRPLPAGGVIAGAAVAVLAQLVARVIWRLTVDRGRLVRTVDARTKPGTFGVGKGGEQIRSLYRDPHSGCLPVGLFGDHRVNRSTMGTRVLGGRNVIASVAAQAGATCLLLAMPTLPSTDAAASPSWLRSHAYRL